MSEPLIVFRKVSFGYRPRDLVLEEVDLEIRPEEMVCLVGPNGGGKSTLFKLLLGICEPVSGSVTVGGAAPKAACRRIGYVPQYFKLDEGFPVSVGEVVLMGRLTSRWRWRYSREDRRIAAWALREVELDGMERASFATLSGGQRQRVLIARALATRPEILLLDEPLSSLDPVAQQHFYELLRRLHRQMTVLMVSHDRQLVSELFDYALCVDRRVRVHPITDLESGIASVINMKWVLHQQDESCCQ